MKNVDILIIGAGIVGLATAFQLRKKFPNHSIQIIEKEEDVAKHQTGHNSGVIHTGIYYKPGSLKATNCIRGKKLLLEFCDEEGIEYKKISKLIVATKKEELTRMHALYDRGLANGLPGLKLLEREEVKEREPYINAEKAILNEDCHIISYTSVAQKFKNRLLERGVGFSFGECVSQIQEIENHSLIQTNIDVYKARHFINCAGLYSDHIARDALQGTIKDKIIPFRGEYYFLKQELCNRVSSLIYPVPNPQLPFLGVHITPMIDGRIEAGPNAVLAFAREGYSKTSINPKEFLETLLFPGFWKVSAKHMTTGIYEMYRSFSKRAFLKSVQELMPSLTEEDITPGGAGVRAQLVKRDGSLCDDFCLIHKKNMMHVINAPSPAATSCLAIGEHVVNTMFPS